MNNAALLKRQIKDLMVQNLMLQVSADQISDQENLFGPGGLGLDSVDALQLVVALDKTYGLKVPSPEVARKILQNVTTIAEALSEHLANPAVPPESRKK